VILNQEVYETLLNEAAALSQ